MQKKKNKEYNTLLFIKLANNAFHIITNNSFFFSSFKMKFCIKIVISK